MVLGAINVSQSLRCIIIRKKQKTLKELISETLFISHVNSYSVILDAGRALMNLKHSKFEAKPLCHSHYRKLPVRIWVVYCQLGIRNSEDRKDNSTNNLKDLSIKNTWSCSYLHFCDINNTPKYLGLHKHIFSFLCKSKQATMESTPNSHYSNFKPYLIVKN